MKERTDRLNFIKPKKLVLQRTPFKEEESLRTEGKYLQTISKALVYRINKRLSQSIAEANELQKQQMVARRLKREEWLIARRRWRRLRRRTVRRSAAAPATRRRAWSQSWMGGLLDEDAEKPKPWSSLRSVARCAG